MRLISSRQAQSCGMRSTYGTLQQLLKKLGYLSRLSPIGIQIALGKPLGDIFFRVRSNRILPVTGRWLEATQARHT
jgi:hypothetical protein